MNLDPIHPEASIEDATPDDHRWACMLLMSLHEVTARGGFGPVINAIIGEIAARQVRTYCEAKVAAEELEERLGP
jgi:hypothetical protein